MSDKSWKALERRIAASLGTSRTPLSGGNSKQTQSDTLHESFYVEVKMRKKIPFMTTYEDTVKKARVEKKIPIVVFHLKGSKRNIVMLELENFIELEEQEVY